MSAKPGSLENPEVYENVPGHDHPRDPRGEFDDFDNEAEKFLAGETRARTSSSASASSRASTGSASPTSR